VIFQRRTLAGLVLLTALLPCLASAAPLDLFGTWYELSGTIQDSKIPAPSGLAQVSGPSRTGGHYLYTAEFDIDEPGRYVIDFKNSSTLGRFRHRVHDAAGKLVADLSGGIQSLEENPFLLRHGRELVLDRGSYRLTSELDSPFFLAQPVPFVDKLEDYRQAIKAGNVLVLVCLGVFVGLGAYYGALAVVHRRVADLMYTLFILGNLLYNGSALLVYPDVFGMHWFYLVSVPILFSNAAYVAFVMALLELNQGSNPYLFRAGFMLLGVFAMFGLGALLYPNWSLEFDRYGVALFATYGVVAATVRAREGHPTARYYLVAVAALFVLGMVAISVTALHAYTIYVEHVGLIAVAFEVILLALVLTRQLAERHGPVLFGEKPADTKQPWVHVSRPRA
jgi:hypothetical protein